MVTKARLGLYLEDEEIKRQIKVAAAKRGLTVTEYCVRAIEEQLVKDGERNPVPEAQKEKSALLVRMEQLRTEIGAIGVPTWKLVEKGRQR